jgi:hypothetical protein
VSSSARHRRSALRSARRLRPGPRP